MYKIIKFHEKIGSITILVESTQATFNIDLPIDGDKYVTGDDLDVYIRGFIPKEIEKRVDVVKKVSNSSDIEKLISPVEVNPEEEEAAIVAQTEWEQKHESDTIFIRELIQNVLIEKGLIDG